MTSRPVSQFLNIKDIESKIKKAKKGKKIFKIVGGYELLRASLIDRGWIEQIPSHELSLLPSASERYVQALALKNHPCYFIWNARKTDETKSSFNRNPLSNSIVRKQPFDFTSKNGLHNCVNNYKWHHIDDLTDLNYQRSHVLEEISAKDEFVEDFQTTACSSFLMFLDNEKTELSLLFTANDDGISVDCVNYATKVVELAIRKESGEDLDNSISLDFESGKQFLNDFRQITNGTKKFKLLRLFMMEGFKAQVHEMATRITSQWPSKKYDGFFNIWIVKPANLSMGRDVQVLSNLNKILMAALTPSRTYIVQKYIEKPLLIHNRKFDLRIYFMTFIREGFFDVWVYKDCYVKFSTPPFNLINLDRSIHLTNYSVQKHYMNPIDAVPGASENMWSLLQLVEHFNSIGKTDLWKNKVYPKIKKNLLGVILSSLESTELTVNSFELNGADFMIGYDEEPILIEINSRPALFLNDFQVKMITRKLLEDMLKVVVDRKNEEVADTGDFELFHSHEIPEVPKMSKRFNLTGSEIKKHFSPMSRNFQNESNEAPAKLSKINLTFMDDPIYLKEKIVNIRFP